MDDLYANTFNVYMVPRPFVPQADSGKDEFSAKKNLAGLKYFSIGKTKPSFLVSLNFFSTPNSLFPRLQQPRDAPSGLISNRLEFDF